ncbi:hypothetical protein BJV78DRAFT_1371109 [Lactifluus subvellereus]|nr:hypothetical protein BJV78DRAFT_1371109 [Lactifluus subvellereus]
MTWLLAARLVTFVTTILFSIIVIALSAALVAQIKPRGFSAFALATGLLTVITIVPMYGRPCDCAPCITKRCLFPTYRFIIDMLQKGTFFSYIIVEIVWLKVLWVLWLSSGSYAAWMDSQITCGDPQESTDNFGIGVFNGGASQGCGKIKPVTAFSFLLWILLTAYTSTLLGLSIRAHSRGHSIWTTGVRDGALFHPAEKASTSPAQVYAAPVTDSHSHPPAPPQSLPNTMSQLSPGIPRV